MATTREMELEVVIAKCNERIEELAAAVKEKETLLAEIDVIAGEMIKELDAMKAALRGAEF